MLQHLKQGSSTHMHTHLLKIVSNCLSGSVLPKPVVEGLCFAVLGLNEETGGTLERQSYSGSCSPTDFIWRPSIENRHQYHIII